MSSEKWNSNNFILREEGQVPCVTPSSLGNNLKIISSIIRYYLRYEVYTVVRLMLSNLLYNYLFIYSCYFIVIIGL